MRTNVGRYFLKNKFLYKNIFFYFDFTYYFSGMENKYKEILQHLANGKKQIDLPRLMDRSQQAISLDMRMLRAELGATTTYHALAIAFRRKLVK